MDVKDYIKNFNLPYDQVKTEFETDYNALYKSEEEWLENLENKTHLLKNEKNEEEIKQVIQKLKSNEQFQQTDTEILSTFVSKINTIVKIANRINNFKEGTDLDNGSKLKLYDLFNSIQNSDELINFSYTLNSNLNNFLSHIYSVIKHCQSPSEYPIYYKYWKNILREVLSKKDDYDSMCKFYRGFPFSNRHLNFATYLGTIGIQIGKNIHTISKPITKDSKEYKYLTNDVINIERYKTILDSNLNNENESETHVQYWIYSPGENASHWDEFQDKGIMGLGWDEIGDLNQYTTRDDIKNALEQSYGGTGSKKNNVSANHDFKTKIRVGDIIIAKRGRSELLGYGEVTSDYNYSIQRKDFRKIRDVEWKLKGNWKIDFSLVLKTLTDITKYKSNDPNFDTYYNQLLGIMGVDSKIKNLKNEFASWLINKYGESSGASSSYVKAIEILSNTMKKAIFSLTDDQYLEELYDDLIRYQKEENGKYYNPDAPSYGNNGFYSASIKSYREFLKSNDSSTIKNVMNFPLNTILYGPPGTGKTYNTILRAARIIESRDNLSYEEALEIFKANLHDQIEFITFHQNYSYEDFIQGLRPETDNKSSLVFNKKDGIFKRIADRALENLILVEKAPHDLSNEAKFNKALEDFSDKILENEDDFKINDTAFIFEVEEDAFRYTGEKWTNHSNGLRMKFSDLKEFFRNNVSSRKDVKKLKSISGLANQHATYYFLVYNEILKFLPTNTDSPTKIDRKNYVIIIDEINRANLLDIALRRRFVFESMYPKYEIKDQKIYDSDILKKINEQIIKSKGHDFQIGHAYFMGENKDLVQRMNKKVIPLLLEYYMNDEKEVKAILNSAGLIIVTMKEVK